ncbi:MAG: hypothetical protein Q8S73_18310 [Deltaproteobacteria bacterium]|nr:hypothetical protein [Myxococcales bacterium]MDP3216066.1 hypothetical protein [Deltaproteobacteria bacterium]
MRALTRNVVMASMLAGCADERPPGFNAFDAGDATMAFPDRGGGRPDGTLPVRAASPYPTYHLTVTLPFNGPEQTFDMEAEPRATKLDVHLNVDTTGSFNGEIANLKLSLGSNIIPALRARVGDLAMGVSRFAEFPVAPFGRNTDAPYNLLTPITTDLGRVTAAVNSLDRPLQNGGDPPEPWGEALYQIATGEGLQGLPLGNIPRFTPSPGTAPGSVVGGVGFRAGAARVVINVTDAPSHEPADYGDSVPGTRSTQAAGAALAAIGARMIGIASGEGSREQMEAIAMRTGAVAPATAGRCSTGVGGVARPAVGGMCPLVFDIAEDGTGLGAALVDGILRFLDSLAFAQVSGRATDDPHGFVQAIEALSARVPDGATPPLRADLAPAGMPDGVMDTFTTVPTRTRLTFRVRLRNTTRPESEYPQLYFVRVTLVGDGVTVDERVVRVIVPEGPKPDGGDGGADAVVPADVAPEMEAGTDIGTDIGADAGADGGLDSAAEAVDDAGNDAGSDAGDDAAD